MDVCDSEWPNDDDNDIIIIFEALNLGMSSILKMQ